MRPPRGAARTTCRCSWTWWHGGCLFAIDGRDGATVAAFMSRAFITGVTEHLGEPDGHQPQVVFDRYHVAAKAYEAVDTVRRAEAKTRPELKRSRYAWLKNDANLTAGQRT